MDLFQRNDGSAAVCSSDFSYHESGLCHHSLYELRTVLLEFFSNIDGVPVDFILGAGIEYEHDSEGYGKSERSFGIKAESTVESNLYACLTHDLSENGILYAELELTLGLNGIGFVAYVFKNDAAFSKEITVELESFGGVVLGCGGHGDIGIYLRCSGSFGCCRSCGSYGNILFLFVVLVIVLVFTENRHDFFSSIFLFFISCLVLHLNAVQVLFIFFEVFHRFGVSGIVHENVNTPAVFLAVGGDET